jgi:fermentation-respiration switch protein FrsA (DUF1100 family)
MERATKTRITFESGGETLLGNLYLPEGDEPAGLVVAVGPLTSVKEQAAGTYAQALAERGYAALALTTAALARAGAGRGSSRTPKPTSRTSRTPPARFLLTIG